MKAIKVRKGVGMTMDAGDNPTFEQWCERVNRFFWKYVGCDREDLPDCPWRDWYESRVRPIRAANKALKRAGAFV